MKKWEILYEDGEIFVLWKPAGLAVQSARPTVPDLESLLGNELRERGEDPKIHLINRLDQPVEGLLLAARNPKVAAALSAQVSGHIHMEKWYQAVVCGKLSQKEGTLVDDLIRDGRTNTSRTAAKGERGAKKSELWYRVLAEEGDRSLLEIRLLTGRHHQIRVQLSHAGAPILGDVKYGGESCRSSQLCLCCSRLSFIHPGTKKPMSFQVDPTFPVPPKAL